jgi:uncharacterized protein YjbI with pentapeptide repeats
LDFSEVNAHGAYWGKCDFSYSDFYAANISRASFRRSNLSGVQSREGNLQYAILGVYLRRFGFDQQVILKRKIISK